MCSAASSRSARRSRTPAPPGCVADGLTAGADHLPGSATVGLIVLASMLVTPFLHHAAAVLVLGTGRGGASRRTSASHRAVPDGGGARCACDFLTPIGHQNSTLVMAPAGYRFSDYWRLGAPLTLLVCSSARPLILYYLAVRG